MLVIRRHIIVRIENKRLLTTGKRFFIAAQDMENIPFQCIGVVIARIENKRLLTVGKRFFLTVELAERLCLVPVRGIVAGIEGTSPFARAERLLILAHF